MHERQSDESILLGDFNLHHPLWGGSDVRPTDSESEDLAAIMEDLDLSSTLRPGTITYEERASRSPIDICLVTVGLVDRIIRSQVDRDLDHNSDHLSISTVVDMRVQQLDATPKRGWRRLNEQVYQKALKQALPPLRRPANKTALGVYIREIIEAIQKAIEKAVSQTRPLHRSKVG